MRQWLIPCLSALLAAAGCAQQPAAALSEEEMDALVNQLADVGEGPPAPTAMAAERRLEELGIAAFPALIRGLDDGRSAAIKGAYAPDTAVSNVCLWILESQVAPFTYQKGGPHYFYEHDPVQWWRQRQGRPLRELQIEVVTWTIGQIESDPNGLGRERLDELRRVLGRLERGRSPR